MQANTAAVDAPHPLRYRVFALTWLSYVSYYLTRRNYSVAKASIQDTLGVSTKDLGYIDMAFSATYAVGQFVSGALADRIGPRRVLGAGMMLTAVCAVAFGASSMLVWFLVFFGLNGFAQSTGWSSNVKAMTGWFPLATRGAVMGYWTTNYTIGGLVANPVAHHFLTLYGWRAAFWGPAIGVGLLGVAMLLWLPERQVAKDEASVAAVIAARRAARGIVLRTPMVWALGGSYFFLKLARYFFWYWGPFYMEKVLGYSKGLSATAPLVFDGAGILGAITIGWISDRYFRGRRVPVAIVSLLLLAVALNLYSWAAPQGLVLNLLVLALCGFFLFGPDAIVSATAAQDIGGPAAAATAAGIINGMGSVGQVFAGPLAPERSADADWGLIYGLLGGGAVLAACILAPFWKTMPPKGLTAGAVS
jgi:sugar phosphate permease